MSDFVSTIKELSHKVAEEYLILGKSMNESLVSMYNDGLIETREVLKRICEQANQNVYLSLFNSAGSDKGNISFDLADYEFVNKNISQSESSMNDYNTSPSDFRSALELSVEKKASLNVPEDGSEKLAALNRFVQQRDVYTNMLNGLGALKTAEIRSAENSFNKIASNTRVMVANGESVGDIAKISMRHVGGMGLNCMSKVAGAYDMIHKDMLKDGFHVSSDFTKMSSLSINSKAPTLAPVAEFSLSIEKIAAINEMESNIQNVLNGFDTVIEKAVK